MEADLHAIVIITLDSTECCLIALFSRFDLANLSLTPTSNPSFTKPYVA